MPVQRTEWAERYVEEFLALPFIAEFVYRDLRTVVNRKEEQVADFLILQRESGILIELKCQEDPDARGQDRTTRWARKKSREGWRQVRRALTRQRRFPMWCNHSRMGRKEFPAGLPPIRQGLVLLEVSQIVDLNGNEEPIPLGFEDTPISCFSLHDFLNLAVQLRSIPELLDYLDARRTLPQDDLRLIGDEKTLFSYYLLNGGSFTGCLGRSDARVVVAAREDRLHEALQSKFETDRYALLIEHVADELAHRDPALWKTVPPEFVAAYDPDQRRQNYREMQAALADLRLRERAELGRALDGAAERLAAKDRGITFRTARFDSMPEWVYVLTASKKFAREELLPAIFNLMGGAMAFYGKPKCLVIAARDKAGYEVALSQPGARVTEAHLEVGRRLFGSLRVTSAPLHFLPSK